MSYRLEPDGIGTRYPLLMERLHAGRLDGSDAAAALKEIDDVAAALQRLPATLVVWSLTDLRPRPAGSLPVAGDARVVYDLFVTHDGRPLLGRLRDGVIESLRTGSPLVIDTARATAARKGAAALTLLGLAWLVGGHLLFPSVILTHAGGKHGPLAWPFGALFLLGGLVARLGAWRPSIAELTQRHPWLIVTSVALLATGLSVATWR